MKLATAAQIQAMDRTAIGSFGVPGMVLMENAALDVVAQIVLHWSPVAGKRIAVVCGKGNNGGDGLAAARQLVARHAAKVSVWLTEEPGAGREAEFETNLKLARNFGLDVKVIDGGSSFDVDLAASDLIVDAVLGTGLVGDPRALAARAIEAINAAGRPVISIDLPSGLNADTGIPGTPTVRASVTVTFVLSKPGLHLYPGIDYRGELVVSVIGFPPDLRNAPEINCCLTGPEDVAAWLPSRAQARDANKGRFGSVLLLAGSPGFAGAASLCASGASRSGAGLVTLGVPKSLFKVIMARAPESVMTRPFAQTPTGRFSPAAIKSLLDACEHADAVGIGPGIGNDISMRDFVARFVSLCPIPIVIDADALNALAAMPDHGASILCARKAATILTPHPGEMARLLGCSPSAVQSDRIGALKEAVNRFQCVVVLKGSQSLTASPAGHLAVNETGNPGMSSGGSGDLLTGMATTFLAQTAQPWRAAAAAAYVHGLAGDLAAEAIGAAGLLATDIAEYVPRALKKCGI